LLVLGKNAPAQVVVPGGVIAAGDGHRDAAANGVRARDRDESLFSAS
jgi:hypothetical protein